MNEPAATPRTLLTNWTRFWFFPRQALGLHLIRILFGILVLCWLLPLAGYLGDFFGFDGWFDKVAFAEVGEAWDRHSWSLHYLVADNPALLTTFYWVSIAVVVVFTLGFFTRITAVLTWLVVISFTSNPLIETDTDVFFRLFAFYLMLGYLLIDWLRSTLPLPVKLFSPWNHSVLALGKAADSGSYSSAATMTLRLMQVHFALAIVIMGLHKLQIAEWWAGVSYWFPMHRAAETSLETINDLRTRAVSYLNWMSLASYLVLAWQISFPTFAWRTGLCRWILLIGAITGMIGLMVIYPIPLLGPTFFLLCLTYLTDYEWSRLFSPLLRLVNSKN